MREFVHTTCNPERPPEEQTNNSHETPSKAGRQTVPDLKLAVVKYDERPNRGTIHPTDQTKIEQMETWISIDMSVVTDLSLWR